MPTTKNVPRIMAEGLYICINICIYIYRHTYIYIYVYMNRGIYIHTDTYIPLKYSDA